MAMDIVQTVKGLGAQQGSCQVLTIESRSQCAHPGEPDGTVKTTPVYSEMQVS